MSRAPDPAEPAAGAVVRPRAVAAEPPSTVTGAHLVVAVREQLGTVMLSMLDETAAETACPFGDVAQRWEPAAPRAAQQALAPAREQLHAQEELLTRRQRVLALGDHPPTTRSGDPETVAVEIQLPRELLASAIAAAQARVHAFEGVEISRQQAAGRVGDLLVAHLTARQREADCATAALATGRAAGYAALAAADAAIDTGRVSATSEGLDAAGLELFLDDVAEGEVLHCRSALERGILIGV
ncbi:hypothetical protein Q5424_08380 [Conexibacter sp. JD483]|uniref:hypothetical protein n=1 Tax=unclassified Conexibacter TaxID=2627773 RepID=UPI002724DEC8|nr:MULTISPECIES: hypothetical protein [unclassified Conexibacter]MDO8183945.1 hypothetical protein [Conexibacter sp. CPCC 205706]MDO8196937.1 hypothetical protein [Conexibacter sp. CPCC 205762]MDR9369093.1 hypothetical protein [Conexibacter sp. JD483]